CRRPAFDRSRSPHRLFHFRPGRRPLTRAPLCFHDPPLPRPAPPPATPSPAPPAAAPAPPTAAPSPPAPVAGPPPAPAVLASVSLPLPHALARNSSQNTPAPCPIAFERILTNVSWAM